MTRYDTYFELVPVGDGSGASVTTQFGFDRTLSVAGFQMTLNMWLKALLTEQGSDLSDREYGTGFTQLIGANVSSRRDVRVALELAIESATSDIRRYQEEHPPNDDAEVLEDVTIESIVFSSDNTRVDVGVRLENRAKKILRLQLPIQR